MAKSSRGSFTVEFHRLLPEIKQKFESGTIVAKIIYDELYKDGKITMTYNRFAAYFRKEISGKSEGSTPKKEDGASPVLQSESEQASTGSNKEPLILRGTNAGKTSFSPHTRTVDEKDIL